MSKRKLIFTNNFKLSLIEILQFIKIDSINRAEKFKKYYF